VAASHNQKFLGKGALRKSLELSLDYRPCSLTSLHRTRLRMAEKTLLHFFS